MYKGVAGQIVSAGLVTASTLAAFTGTVTCYVTGDSGSQALGSVGSGVCTSKGNGEFQYAPSAAEVSYDHMAFTFIGTLAMPVTVNVWTRNNALAGLTDSGTAQSATSTTLVLRAADSFADSELVGSTLVITGGSTGVGQARVITGYVGSTDTATVDAWTTTPTGTITYAVFATAPASASTPPAVNATQFAGQTITAAAGVTLPSSIASPTNITAGTITTVTNLTNAPTAGDLTATMKTSVTTAATAATPIAASVTGGATAAGLATLTTTLNTSRYQKNAIAADIPVVMVDSTDHVTRKTGLTLTVTRSIDGGAFGSATGTAAEIANGVYQFDASAADMNGNNIVLRFTGTAADPVELHIKTYT